MAAGRCIVANLFKFYRHNSLMGIAYVKLFHITKDLKYRDAALLLADHLVEMNLNRESFLFSGPEDARLWKIETRGGDRSSIITFTLNEDSRHKEETSSYG